MSIEYISKTPCETFTIGEKLGASLVCGDVVLLFGGLGAGKTLLAKGILQAFQFDVDEVTSPSFTLVNRYETASFDVYHIDLWRLNGKIDAAAAVGLDDILETKNAVTIIEWADRLGDFSSSNTATRVMIEGDGDEPRKILVEHKNTN